MYSKFRGLYRNGKEQKSAVNLPWIFQKITHSFLTNFSSFPSKSLKNPYRKDRSKLYQSLISLLLIGLCVSMSALGVLVLMENWKVNEFEEWFVAAYMVLFSVLLFLYEAMWWCTVGPLNRVLRKNFGFMYKIYGKALYLILVSCLCFGISPIILMRTNMDWLRWFTGIAWGGTGVGLIIMKCFAPHILQNYTPPTAGLISSNAGLEDGNEQV